MICLVDNYDSFVYNLRRYLIRLGQEVVVARNDQIDLDDPVIANYEAIVISPGPQTPDQAGVCLELVHRFHERVPMLGVCLGHQAIWQALGGRIVRATTPVHGRASKIQCSASPLFTGIVNPLTAARYHSLVADVATQPPNLRVIAWTEDREVMAIEHLRLPVFGLQFHPESILTTDGYRLLRNFLVVAGATNIPAELPANDLLDSCLTETLGGSKSEDGSEPFAVFPGSDWR